VAGPGNLVEVKFQASRGACSGSGLVVGMGLHHSFMLEFAPAAVCGAIVSGQLVDTIFRHER
jgi:hypothetical protein